MDIAPAQVLLPVPKFIRGTEIPPALAASFARPGFEAEVVDGKMRVSRTGVALLKGDPTAGAQPIDKPIEGQELRNLSGIVAMYEASLDR